MGAVNAWLAGCDRTSDNSRYNLIFQAGLDMQPSLPQVLSALSDTASAHESLRTVFVDGPDGLMQRVRQYGEFEVHIEDAADDGDDPEPTFRRWEDQMANRGYKLDSDEPMRAIIVTSRHRPRLIGLCLPHIASDLVSLRVITGELRGRLLGHTTPPAARQPIEHAAFEHHGRTP